MGFGGGEYSLGAVYFGGCGLDIGFADFAEAIEEGGGALLFDCELVEF